MWRGKPANGALATITDSNHLKQPGASYNLIVCRRKQSGLFHPTHADTHAERERERKTDTHRQTDAPIRTHTHPRTAWNIRNALKTNGMKVGKK